MTRRSARKQENITRKSSGSEKKVLIFCKGDWCLVVMNSSVRYFIVSIPWG